MDHLVLYNRPKGDPWPRLMLVGMLDGYELNQAYSGRLQILNQRGDCTAALVKGSLPPGTVIWVDNPAKEVVVEFPGYSYIPPPPPDPDDPDPEPPPPPERGLFNGDIEEGAKGWRLGSNWYVQSAPAQGVVGSKGLACTDPVASFAESDPVACDPGTSITAEALWFQGPSNKKNVDLYTQLVWRDAGMREIRVDTGNKVHDQTNTRSHWSRVTASAPPGTAFASVRLLMYRRRYAREVVVDSVNWTHFKTSPVVIPPKPIKPTEPIPPPPPEYPEEFPITIGCWDAAGRYAEWVGVLGEKFIYFTSLLYPVEADDERLAITASITEFVHRNTTTTAPDTEERLLLSASIFAFEHKLDRATFEERLSLSASVTEFKHINPSFTPAAERLAMSASITEFKHQNLSATESETLTLSATIQEFTHV